MGGFLGIGESAEEKQLKEQRRLNAIEIEKSRRDEEIRLAEKKAKKGQEIAKVKLGTTTEELSQFTDKKSKEVKSTPSQSLGLGGGASKTGVQL